MADSIASFHSVLVAAGAWITILALAFDPFIQQILSSRSSLVVSGAAGGATIASAQRWSGGTEVFEEACCQCLEANVYRTRLMLDIDRGSGSSDNEYTCTTPMLNYSMQAAVAFGLSANDHAITQQTPVVCPSANCDFDDHLSLAVCSQCADVTDMMHSWRGYDDDALTDEWPGTNSVIHHLYDTQHSLPNGLHLENADKFDETGAPILMIANSTALPSETLKFSHISTLVIDATTLRAHHDPDSQWKNWSDVRVTAQECALYFCIRRYTSQVVNGTLFERSNEVAAARSAKSWQIQDSPENQGVKGPVPEVDALYDSMTWVSRSDLAIDVPSI